MDKLRGGDVFGSAWQYVLGREERRSTLGYDYLVKLALLGASLCKREQQRRPGKLASCALRPSVSVTRCSSSGNSGVGKSSLLFRFVHSSFCAQLPPTLNVDYSSKVVAFDGRQTKLQIWDTAGHERYRSVSQCKSTRQPRFGCAYTPRPPRRTCVQLASPERRSLLPLRDGNYARVRRR